MRSREKTCAGGTHGNLLQFLLFCDRTAHNSQGWTKNEWVKPSLDMLLVIVIDACLWHLSHNCATLAHKVDSSQFATAAKEKFLDYKQKVIKRERAQYARDHPDEQPKGAKTLMKRPSSAKSLGQAAPVAMKQNAQATAGRAQPALTVPAPTVPAQTPAIGTNAHGQRMVALPPGVDESILNAAIHAAQQAKTMTLGNLVVTAPASAAASISKKTPEVEEEDDEDEDFSEDEVGDEVAKKKTKPKGKAQSKAKTHTKKGKKQTKKRPLGVGGPGGPGGNNKKARRIGCPKCRYKHDGCAVCLRKAFGL